MTVQVAAAAVFHSAYAHCCSLTCPNSSKDRVSSAGDFAFAVAVGVMYRIELLMSKRRKKEKEKSFRIFPIFLKENKKKKRGQRNCLESLKVFLNLGLKSFSIEIHSIFHWLKGCLQE